MRVEEPAVRLLVVVVVRSDSVRIVVGRLLVMYHPVRDLIRRRCPSSVDGCEQLLLLLLLLLWRGGLMIWLTVAERRRGGRLLELP